MPQGAKRFGDEGRTAGEPRGGSAARREEEARREMYALPVAVHVARREAVRSITRAQGLRNDIGELIDSVVIPIRDSFAVGDRLSEADFARLSGIARNALAANGPLLLEEHRRDPTPGRPRSGAVEFLCVTRMGYRSARHGGGISFATLRLVLSRKRAEIEFDLCGTNMRRHLLERSIERDLATWTGRLIEVEDALLASAGLASAWRHAIALGLLPNKEFAFPLGDGLILGEFEKLPGPSGATHKEIRRRVVDHTIRPNRALMPHEPLHEWDAGPEAGEILMAECTTAIDESLLRLPQLDLRDALRGFSARHAPALAGLGRCTFWQRTTIAPHRPYADLSDEAWKLARELAAVLSRPCLAGALRGTECLPIPPCRDAAPPIDVTAWTRPGASAIPRPFPGAMPRQGALPGLGG